MKVLATIAAAAISMLLLSCGTPRPMADTTSESAVQVTLVSPADYKGNSGDALESACGNWKLSPQQVALFFQLSERYDEPPYSSFYQIPCSISGRLNAEGKDWEFVIGGGATATWADGNVTRYWGCSAKACESLVLMPYDGMNPDQ